MLRWTRRRDDAGPSSPTVVCHFCSNRLALASTSGKGKEAQHLPVVAGSWSSFKCSVCQSWNLRDASTGDFVQDARIYSDPSLNPSRSGRPEGPLAASSSSIFCSNCQTNQQLQIQLLAGYLPPDVSLQEEEQRLHHLEAYKASLDERYPVVCELCAEKVEQVIEERNLKAKARTVGGWLKRTTVEQIMDQRSDQEIGHLRAWKFKAVLWHLQYFAAAAICTDRVLENKSYFGYSESMTSRTVHDLSGIRLLSLSLVGLLWSFWDPTYRHRKQTRADVHGQGRWLCLQALMFASRLLLSLAYLCKKSVPSALWCLAACGHILLILLKNRIIYAAGPRRIRLVQRNLPASPQKPSFSINTLHSQGKRSPAQATASDPVFGRSTFGPWKSDAIPTQQRPSHMQPAESEPMNMDWQSTNTASALHQNSNNMDVDMMENFDQSSQRAPLHLKPAIFNPSSENWHESSLGAIRGLERLFEQGVSLAEPTFVQDPSMTLRDPVSRSSDMKLYAGMGVALAGVTALYLRWNSE